MILIAADTCGEFHFGTVLGKFIKDHVETAESAVTSVGGSIALYALLSGPWTFITLGAAGGILAGAIAGLRKLQEIADANADGRSLREQHAILLSLAAREAYLVSAKDEIPKTLSQFGERVLKYSDAKNTVAEIGPEVINIKPAALGAQATAIFAFMERQLLEVLVHAGIQESDRQRYCAKIREQAHDELRLIIASNDKRFARIRNYQGLAMSDEFLAMSTSSSSAATDQPYDRGIAPLEITSSEQEIPVLGDMPPHTVSITAAAEAVPSLPAVLRDAYEQRFEKAKQELEKGSSERASDHFGQIAQEALSLGDPTLDTLRARCLHNQGVSLYNMGNCEEAAKCFEEAITIPEGTKRTMLGRFFAPYCRGDYPTALAQIRELIKEYPEETTFGFHEANCLARMEKVDEAFAILEGSPKDTEEHHTLMSQLLSQQERFGDAEQAAREGLKVAPDSEQLAMALLFAQLKPLFDRLHRERQTRRYLASTDRDKMVAAKDEYLKLAESAELNGLRRIAAECFAMMGCIFIQLHEPMDAVHSFDRSLSLISDDKSVWINKHAALIEAADYDEALKVVEEAAAIIGLTESIGRRAATYLKRGAPGRALELIEEAFSKDASLKTDSTLRVVWLQCLGVSNRSETKAETLAYVSKSDRTAGELISAAEIMEAIDEQEDATKLIARAEEAAKSDEDDTLLVRTISGMLFYRRDEWGEAIKRLGTDGMDPAESEHVVEIIICLINLGDLPGAVALAERVIGLGRGSILIERALVHCYVRIGRESAAEPLLRKIVDVEGRFDDRLALFQILQRLKPLRTALPVLEKAVQEYPEKFEGHLILSGVYHALKQNPLSLHEARRAYKIAPDHIEVIRNFVRFMPDTFPSDLLNDADKAIIAKAIEDRSTFTPIELGNKDGEIDVTPLLGQLKNRREHVAKVMEYYRKHHLPLCFTAEAIGETLFDIWWTLSLSKDEQIFATRGDTRTQKDEAKACDNDTIVLDATALFTLAALKLLDLPLKCYRKVFVDSATLARLKNELLRLTAEPATRTVAQYHEGKLLMMETDPADHQIRIEMLSTIVDLLHNDDRIQIQGPSAKVWNDFENDERARSAAKAMPEGALTPALLAKSERASYYCDDQGLCSLTTNELKISGFSTQALLKRAMNLGLIDGQVYHASIVTLIERNHYFVSIDRQFIRRAIKEKKFICDRLGHRLVSEMGATTFGDHAGAMELGATAGFLWFNTHSHKKPSRMDWIPVIADAVAELPEKNSALLSFLGGVMAELIWFPEAFIGLTEYLIHDAGLSPKVVKGLRMARYIVTEGFHDSAVLGEINLAKKWRQSFSDIVEARRLANVNRRL